MEALLLIIIACLLGGIGYFIKDILDNTKVIIVDVADMKPKVDVLWTDKFAPAHSPRQLNDRGKSILNDSGIKEIIDEKRVDLLTRVRVLNPANAYDAEQGVLSVVKNLETYCPDIIPRLKEGAFRVGQNPEALLLVGGIYLRDLVFPDLGFSIHDLDRPQTPPTSKEIKS